MPPVILDLTGRFTELAFCGSVAITERGSCCDYRFVDFAIDFVEMPDPRLTKAIRLSHFVMSFHTANEVLRDYIPFDATRSAELTAGPKFCGTFSAPKQRILAAKYLTFAVMGVFFVEFHDDEGIRLAGGAHMEHRCTWPIAARCNRIVEQPEKRFPRVRYRQPSDFDDPCAPERVH